MLDTSSLALFIAASLALLLVPGPAVLYIVARSVSQGRMSGFVSTLGVALGSLVHVLAAALGLSALLISSALAFTIVKYMGALYLIYLGISTLLAPTQHFTEAEVDAKPLGRIFRQGIIVNVLNPKTALFFFAFLPQFVEANHSPIALQILLLGAIFITMGMITDGLYAIGAGTLGTWLKQNPIFPKVQKYLSGTIYILLGITTAVSGNGNE